MNLRPLAIMASLVLAALCSEGETLRENYQTALRANQEATELHLDAVEHRNWLAGVLVEMENALQYHCIQRFEGGNGHWQFTGGLPLYEPAVDRGCSYCINLLWSIDCTTEELVLVETDIAYYSSEIDHWAVESVLRFYAMEEHEEDCQACSS